MIYYSLVFIKDLIKECDSQMKKLHIEFKNTYPVQICICAFSDDHIYKNENELQINLEIWNETLKVNNNLN